jgi:hypothetical protein
MTLSEMLVDTALVVVPMCLGVLIAYRTCYDRGERGAYRRYLRRRPEIERAEQEFAKLWEQSNASWNAARYATNRHVREHNAACAAWRRLQAARGEDDA